MRIIALLLITLSVVFCEDNENEEFKVEAAKYFERDLLGNVQDKHLTGLIDKKRNWKLKNRWSVHNPNIRITFEKDHTFTSNLEGFEGHWKINDNEVLLKHNIKTSEISMFLKNNYTLVLIIKKKNKEDQIYKLGRGVEEIEQEVDL